MAPLTLLVVCAKLDAFFVLIFAYLVNKEVIVPRELIGIVICFGSVIVITCGQDDAVLNENEKSNLRVLGICLSILHALFLAGAAVLTRTLNSVSILIIIFWNSLIGLLGGLVLILIQAWSTGQGF